MINSLPQCLKKLAEKLDKPLYVTGGAVRNYIAGLVYSDFDICAALSPETVCGAALELNYEIEAVYEATFTVKLRCGDFSFEYTSFRTESYQRGHTPSRTELTDDINADARRRDFKCNAVYYDIKNRRFKDVLGGVADIKNKVMSAVKNPDEVFAVDGLRILRLARQCGELGFTPEQNTLSAAAENCANLKDIHPERIFAELCLILKADRKHGIKDGHYNALKILIQTGALREIMPELEAGAGMAQRSDYHKYDVLEHSLRAAKYAEPEVRLAALLHDIGKPYCYNKSGKFHGHDKAGAEIAASVLRRLKAPKRLTDRIKRIIALHMYDFNLTARTSKIKRLIVENYSVYRDLLKVIQADFSAAADNMSESPVILKWEKIRTDMLYSGTPFKLGDLKINGHDLMELGFSGKQIREALAELFWRCVASPDKNNSQYLLMAAKGIKDEAES